MKAGIDMKSGSPTGTWSAAPDGWDGAANTRTAERTASRPPQRVVVRAERRFRARAARVFAAWLDPDVARQWLFATATRPLASVEIDARVGGSFRLVDRGVGSVAEYRGTYVDIARPRRLSFTLVLDRHPNVVMRVGVEITPQRNGCELMLTHENVPLHDAVDIEGRWTGVLYGLDATLQRSTRRLTTPRSKR